MSDELKENEVKQEAEVETPSVDELLENKTVIEKPSAESDPYYEVIEKARLAFNKKYAASRRNSYIAMGLVLAIAIASVIFITRPEQGFKIAGWACIGTAVVGMLTYYIITRNSLPNATQDYIEVVNKNLNSRNFSDQRFADVVTDKNEKLELADAISDGIYKGLNNIASRNVIEGHFEGRSFRVGDCGLYSGAGRNRASLFVGKHISYPNELHFENRYILVMKGESAVDLPNDIDDLKPIIEEDNFIVYGKEDSKPAGDLGKDFLNAIRRVKVEKHLLNLNIVIWSGHSAVYASYDDAIMTLPFQKPYDKEINEQYADNLVDIFEALALLAKKEK